jgi:hypothetical protein
MYVTKPLPYVRQLAARFVLLRPTFNHRANHAGFVTDKVAKGQVNLRAILFSPVNYHSINAPYSFIYHSGDRIIGPVKGLQFHTHIFSPHTDNK